MEFENPIPIIIGDAIKPTDPEYREMMKYESGSADEDAAKVPGRHNEPWLNVLEAFEPGSPPSLEFAINHPYMGGKICGKVLDMGAGTCWATARLSRLERVQEVVALDMSQRFLSTVGSRIINHHNGDKSKIKFAVSSFNHTPFDDKSFDCVFLIAAIHHSLSLIKTLLEANRVLKNDGVLIIIESPSPLFSIRKRREAAIQISRQTGATEICFTKGELIYMLRHALFDKITFYPVPARGEQCRIKKAARIVMRILFIEKILRPPTYVIISDKYSKITQT